VSSREHPAKISTKEEDRGGKRERAKMKRMLGYLFVFGTDSTTMMPRGGGGGGGGTLLLFLS